MLEWIDDIEEKIINNEQIDLIKDLPVKKDLWLKNFVKSAVSTTLIALSFNFIFDGFHKHPHDHNEILLGIIAFLIAMLVIFTIDKYHQKVRELELKSINANIKNVQSYPNFNDYLVNKTIVDEKIEEIVKKELKEALLEDE